MTESGRAGEQNLTGIWNGLYTYPNGRSTSFVATLIDSGGSLSGTTHEPGSLGGTLYASLVGSRNDSAVGFTKTYDRRGLLHRKPIIYEGTLNGDATEIEGRWTIKKVWSGKFMMVRSGSQAASVERKAVEPVR
jgi:hypothetical protein